MSFAFDPNLDQQSGIGRFFPPLLAIGLLALAAGFFVCPTPGSHEQIFLYLVNLPAVLALLFLWKRLHPALTDRLFLFTLLTLFYLAASSFWAPNFEPSILGYWGRRILAITCLCVAVHLVVARCPGFGRLLLRLIAVAAGVVAVAVLINHFQETGGSFSRVSITKGSFLTLGRYNNTIRVGWVWGGSALVTTWLFLRTRGWACLWPAAFLIPQLLLFTLTLSRGAVLAFLLTTPLAFALSASFLREKKKILLPLAFLALAVAVVVMSGLGSSLGKGFARGWKPEKGLDGLSHRLSIWQTVVEETKDSMILGQGYTKKAPVTAATGKAFPHSHNFLVSVFRFSGLLGVVLVTAHLLFCLQASMAHKDRGYRIWGLLLLYGCLCLLTNGKYPLASLSEFWFIYWLPISVIYGLRSYNYSPQSDCLP